MKKKIIVLLLLSVGFIFSINTSYSQPPPPPSEHGAGGNQSNDGGGAPIGDGIWLLTALSAAYGGVRYLRHASKEALEE